MLAFTSLLALSLPLAAFAQYGYDTPAAAKSSSTPMAAAATPTAAAASAIQTVVVGGGPLVYSPSSLVVPMGGKVTFSFSAKNHSVLQSSFAAPCSYAAGGLSSGYAPANATGPYPQYTITVTDVSKPLWFYCSQAAHCGAGMVFSINPTAAQTQAMFVANAMNQTSVLAPASLMGMGVSAAAAPAIVAMSAAEMSMAHASSMATGMVMPGASTASGTVAAAAATAKSGASQISAGLATIFAGLAFAVGL